MSVPVLAPQQKEERRNNIIRAAWRCAAGKGFRDLTIDEICDEAGVSKGSFYLYFASKEDLLAALAKDCAAEMEALADGLGPVGPGAEGRAQLRAWVQRYVDVYRRYGPVVRAWSESQIADPALARLGQRSLRRITSKLTDRIAEASRPPGIDPAPAAFALIGMLERVNYFVLSRDLRVDDAAAVDTLTAVLHTGVFGGRPGRRPPAGRTGRS